MNEIPCCMFPTKLLIVDDDEDFLGGLQFALADKNKVLSVTNLSMARNIILKNKNWVNQLLESGLWRTFEDDFLKFSMTIDISLLHKQIYNPNRFNRIAILIVDYDMPDMNGLDFVRSLGDHQLKIIMLTGKVSQQTVIEAFNQREISCYISKGEPDYLEVLFRYIEQLKNEFFMNFSKFLLESLRSETRIFEKQAFKKLFNQIIKENNIVEYYLLDESGSFLMLDSRVENQIWLIVKSKQDMQLFYELAFEDPHTPPHFIEKLKNNESFTHFKTEKESNYVARNWNLIDCKPLDEEKEFYYAVLKNNNHFKWDQSQIKSYVSFLTEN